MFDRPPHVKLKSNGLLNDKILKGQISITKVYVKNRKDCRAAKASSSLLKINEALCNGVKWCKNCRRDPTAGGNRMPKEM